MEQKFVDTFKEISHFVLSLCQLTHLISSSHAADKQNRSFTLSIASTHLNAIYQILPTLLACVLISCLIPFNTKIA
jgi:hypothetical protein